MKVSFLEQAFNLFSVAIVSFEKDINDLKKM